MQIWIFFAPGTGGDGFANLLERSTNVVPINDPVNYWRIHRIVDNQIKFYAPTVDQLECFRREKPFSLKNNWLHQHYVEAVATEQKCIVTSHDIDLMLLKNSDCQDILTKNQIKVLLVSSNHKQRAYQAAIKNLKKTVGLSLYKKYNPANFDFVLDINEIQSNWEVVKKFVAEVGLDLQYDQYQQYQDLLTGSTTFMQENYNVERYESHIDKNIISYKLVGIFQATPV